MRPTPMPGMRLATTARWTFRLLCLDSSTETCALSHLAKSSCSPPNAWIDSKNSVGSFTAVNPPPAAPMGPPCRRRWMPPPGPARAAASVAMNARWALIVPFLVSNSSHPSFVSDGGGGGYPNRFATVRGGSAVTCLLLAIASVPVLSTRRSGGESDHLLEHLELDSPVRQQVLHRHPVGVSGGLLEAPSDLAAKFRACVRRGVACRADQLSHQREDLAADYERLQVHATATSDAVRCAREVERGRAVMEAACPILVSAGRSVSNW